MVKFGKPCTCIVDSLQNAGDSVSLSTPSIGKFTERDLLVNKLITLLSSPLATIFNMWKLLSDKADEQKYETVVTVIDEQNFI